MDNGYFELPEHLRDLRIKNRILGRLITSERGRAEDRVISLIKKYEGIDERTLNLLQIATEKDMLYQTIEEMEEHYDEILKFVHPKNRKSRDPSIHRTIEFICELSDGLNSSQAP